MKKICVLGSTGSIGVSTLDVVARHGEKYQVVALSANRQVDRLFEQCQRFKPAFAVMHQADSAQQLKKRCQQANLTVEVLTGPDALDTIAALPDVDIVMAAIVGAAGLSSTLSAVQAGKTVLLANKEALVMSGHLFMQQVQQHGATLLPIDSEHNAIFQCLPENQSLQHVARILLTGSGGPFRQWPIEQLPQVTPEQACNHPNWQMGRKISVDSATMMNKGLELIEACWLFDVSVEQVQIVIHPQSVIHSMVSYIDGSVLAQMGNPDMRTPIAHALAWPKRIDAGVAPLDLFSVARLDFERPNEQRFPCLRLAKQAMIQGGSAPAILNAANEVAVEAFLEQRLRFDQISQVIDHCMNTIASEQADCLELILTSDQQARQLAHQYCGQIG